MKWKKELEYAAAVVRGAGRLAMEHFGRSEKLTKTHAAAHAEAVTQADRATQRYIVSELRKQFPRDGIVGEESDAGDAITFECPDPDGRVWVIDPIDGTNNFIAGFENFAVCIGLLEAGRPVVGVVLDVCRNHLYQAAGGLGAWRDQQRLEVLRTPLDDASVLMFTANLLDKDGTLPPFVSRFMGQLTWKIRILGTAALEAVQVAAGVAHGALTINGKLWDVAAPAAIVLEAGGVLTDLAGKAVFPFDLRSYQGAKVPFLAAGPAAHAQLIEALR